MIIAMSYEEGNLYNIIDSVDGTSRECKVVKIDDDNEQILIHYQKWSDKYDEWIKFDSDRILGRVGEPVCKPDVSINNAENPLSASADIREVVGHLLNLGDDSLKKVMTTYSVGAEDGVNEKALSSFSVPILDQCATCLKIDIKNSLGKKIYNKSSLIKQILLKVRALFPSMCAECSKKYSVGLEANAYLYCSRCTRGCHDCSIFQTVHSNMQSSTLKGLVWMCWECMDSPPSNPNAFAANTTGAETIDVEAAEQSESVSPAAGSSDQTVSRNGTSTVPIPICSLYKKNSCPHGLRGTKVINGVKCKYLHPKACTKYCAYGSIGNRGCKDGRQCKFYHPILCRFALKKKLCIKEDCTFVHVRGTKRSNTPGSGSPQAAETNGLNNTNVHASHATVVSGEGAGTVNIESHFLRLENMMKTLAEKQEQDMKRFREELDQMNLAQVGRTYQRAPTYAQAAHPMFQNINPPQPAPMQHWQVPWSQNLGYNASPIWGQTQASQ